MIDVDELLEAGLNPHSMSSAIDRALMALAGSKSPEAEYLSTRLESVQDDCDSF